jgi:hypothetical protein
MWKVNRWRMPSDGKSSLCLWQGELIKMVVHVLYKFTCICTLYWYKDYSLIWRSLEWKVLYKQCSFCPNPLTNMASTGNSCFWLFDF